MATEERCRPWGAAGDVVVHVLAHVPLPASAPPLTRAASLHDPRYVTWARDLLPNRAVAPVAEDAALIASLLARARQGVLLQWLLVAFEDERALTAALRHDAASLSSPAFGDAASAPHGGALAQLLTEDRELVEITWAVVGLVWPAYREAWHHTIGPGIAAACDAVDVQLASVARVVPSIASEVVTLSHPMGVRGRGFAHAIVVGAPADWHDLDASDIAVRVAHEHVVRKAGPKVRGGLEGASSWATSEALALRALARTLRGHPLERAHARFVAGLDLRGLADVDDASVATLVDALAR